MIVGRVDVDQIEIEGRVTNELRAARIADQRRCTAIAPGELKRTTGRACPTLTGRDQYRTSAIAKRMTQCSNSAAAGPSDVARVGVGW